MLSDTERVSVPLRSLNRSRRQILLMRLLQDHRAILLTPNDTKFDQTFPAFKRDLDKKEAATQSQLKKLKTETKASSSFNFKGNKVQYKFDSSLLEVIDGVVDKISRGNLLAANSELERM